MNAWTEYAFLNELQFLCDAAFERGEKIEELAREWSSRDRELYESFKRPAQSRSPKEQSRTIHEKVDDLNDQIARQGAFVAELDAFLGLSGRAGLILFPQSEDTDTIQRERAKALRSVLGIGRDHLLSDRLLRNKWVHFDEVLDLLDVEGVEIHTPLRFRTSDRLDPDKPPVAIRLLVLDTLEIHYRGIGCFDIGAMIQAFRELDSKVREALRTWTDRRLPDLIEET